MVARQFRSLIDSQHDGIARHSDSVQGVFRAFARNRHHILFFLLAHGAPCGTRDTCTMAKVALLGGGTLVTQK